MKGTCYPANGGELTFSNVAAYFMPVSISDFRQAIDMEYKPKFRQGLLIKHIQESAKTSHRFKRFMLVGVG